MQLLHVVGTRPNFVKMAPVIAALRAADPEGRARPRPHRSALRPDDVGHLPRAARRAGARPHARGRLRDARGAARRDRSSAIAPVLEAEQPDLVIVPGDVNSTLAAALACAHLQDPGRPRRGRPAQLRPDDARGGQPRPHRPDLRPALHAFAGGRADNLADEGIDRDRVRLVGNTMIDSLVALEGRFRERRACAEHGLEPGSYLLVTLHRPALVDGPLLAPAIERARRGLGADAGPLPGPSAHPGGARRRRRRAPGRPAPDRPGRLPRLPLAGGRRRRRADRLRRHPGGDDLPRRSLPHAARQHRAADHDRARDQHAARPRSGPDRRDPGPDRRARADPGGPPPLWDGHAAERLATEVVGFLDG